MSGPLLDRFDMRVLVSRADVGELLDNKPLESTAVVAARVAAARELAAARGVPTNAQIPASRLDELAPLTSDAWRTIEWHLRRGSLSARGLHRVRRVARTVADLAGAGLHVEDEHVCTALDLRVEPARLEAAE